jgi:hypothetical protein
LQARNSSRSSRPAAQVLPELKPKERRELQPAQEPPGQAGQQVSAQRQLLESQQVWQLSQRLPLQQVAVAVERPRQVTQPDISKTFNRTHCFSVNSQGGVYQPQAEWSPPSFFLLWENNNPPNPVNPVKTDSLRGSAPSASLREIGICVSCAIASSVATLKRSAPRTQCSSSPAPAVRSSNSALLFLFHHSSIPESQFYHFPIYNPTVYIEK